MDLNVREGAYKEQQHSRDEWKRASEPEEAPIYFGSLHFKEIISSCCGLKDSRCYEIKIIYVAWDDSQSSRDTLPPNASPLPPTYMLLQAPN